MVMLAVVHELEQWIIFEPKVVQLGIFIGGGSTFEMRVNAEGLTLPNPELVVRWLANRDHGIALFAAMRLADSLDVFRGQVHAASPSRIASLQEWQ